MRLDDSAERIELFFGVATSRDSDGYADLNVLNCLVGLALPVPYCWILFSVLFLFLPVSFPFALLRLILFRVYVYTIDVFPVLFRCKWYGMVYHRSLVPFSCVLVLRCTYYFVFFLPSRRFS